MRLEATYAKEGIHEAWESVYRDHPVQRRFNDATMDRLAHYWRPKGKPQATLVVDAGCGVGDHAMRIAQRGFETVGVDLSEHVLAQAQANAERLGLADRMTFQRESLEGLSFADGHFEGVHCRGVLMHIPDWEAALRELCRVLAPGGRIVIIENNTTSVETALVRMIRLVRKGASELRKSPGGYEFWMEREGQPFVWRIANIKRVKTIMREEGLTPIARFATEFWDINRFGSGWKRNLAVRWNQLWWRLRLPAFFSHGNAVVASKPSTS